MRIICSSLTEDCVILISLRDFFKMSWGGIVRKGNLILKRDEGEFEFQDIFK